MIRLYHDVKSPQSRAVLVLLTLLKIKHEIEYVDLASSTEFYPKIFEMNPDNTVPIIDDNELILTDSHAINGYLVDTYASNDSLYPKDPIQRARVDHMLHLDTGLLYPLYRGDVTKVFNEYMHKMLTGLGPKIVQKNKEIFQIIENFLKKSTYIAGDYLTIADISVYTSLTQMSMYSSPERDYHLTIAYMKRCEKNVPDLKSINDEGIQEYRKFVKQIKYKRYARGKAANKERAKKEEEARKAQEAKKAKAKELANKYNVE